MSDAHEDPELAPFERVASRTIVSTPIFALREDQARHPVTGAVGRYAVLEMPDWVNVAAETAAGELVLVRQWRHGSRAIELELPAGLIDAGESPLEAGARELREETGYEAERLREIGVMLPNPAYQANRCTTLLAEGCRRVTTQDLDAGEDIAVELVRAEDVGDLVRSGRMRNSVVLCALLWWLEARGRVAWPGA